jgi:hypothetical protein
MNLSIRAGCDFTNAPQLWRAYAKLDPSVRQSARRAYAIFSTNPDHPSLRFKKLGGYDNIWSLRINEQYRCVGERQGEIIIWVDRQS